MAEVERFTTAATISTHGVFRSETGEYVLFSDYEAAESRCKELERIIGKAATAMERGGVGDGAFSSSTDCALYLRTLARTALAELQQEEEEK
jgi:hypothetical protein